MTREDYLATLAELNLRPASKETAAALGVTVRQLQYLAAGKARVTPTLAKLLAMYRFHGIPDRVRRQV